jgi:hypothetical protein
MRYETPELILVAPASELVLDGGSSLEEDNPVEHTKFPIGVSSL